MNVLLPVRLRPRIVPTGQNLPWLDAIKAVADRGGLPSHPLLDAHLCCEVRSLKTEHLAAINQAFSLYSRNLYAHPAQHGTFQTGRDIRDSLTGSILPWRELANLVAPSDVVRPETGLFIDPKQVAAEKYHGEYAPIIYPASILIVHPAVECYGQWGKVHAPTGMVLEISPTELEKLAWHEQRRLWRSSAEGLCSVARYDVLDGRRYVGAYALWSNVSGAAYVAYDILNDQGKPLVDGSGQLLVKGEVTLADMRRFAAGEIPEALQALPGEMLEAAHRLAIDAKL